MESDLLGTVMVLPSRLVGRAFCLRLLGFDLCGVLVWLTQPLSVALMDLLHYWAINTFTAITTY